MGQRIAAAAVSPVVALWSAFAWAHTSERAPILPTPPAIPSTNGFDVSAGVWIVAALAAAALAIAAARRRKTLGAALVVLTLWMAFQAGAHSVHHLGQPSEEGRCAVASTTLHGSAIPSEISTCVGIVPAQPAMPGDLEPAARGHGTTATHEGRAPPRLSL